MLLNIYKDNFDFILSYKNVTLPGFSKTQSDGLLDCSNVDMVVSGKYLRQSS